MTSEDSMTMDATAQTSASFELPSSNSPKYLRLAHYLCTTYIDQGAPHTLLPTERELQERFNISRDTVRRAIATLQRRGLVYNVQGSGTYVADRYLHAKEPRLISYTEDMDVRGQKPDTSTLRCHPMGADAQTAKNLEIPVGTRVIEIVKIRRADTEPMCYEKAHFLQEVFSHVEPETHGSLDEQLTRSGYRIEKATHRVSATLVTGEEAQALDVPSGSAALRVEKIGYTDRGIAVESTVCLYRADRYDYEFRLSRTGR
ncbi:GntR family transcriptional regulator [Rothia sp. CCM 9418]|uniref:GntR family transcriptional regulator n=1 Tax=unclassified Rothia (in: high G+C Gram-positive bacteria) TaxID=2689056 RepID=UPI003AC22E6D